MYNTFIKKIKYQKVKIRVGRGIGSNKGKTSGRGTKGQLCRNNIPLGFEGGQTPFYKRLPKRGFRSGNRKMCILNLYKKYNLEKYITLYSKNFLITKLLLNRKINKNITIEINDISRKI